MTRALVAGGLLLLGLLIGAPASATEPPFARTIDDMVTQLRADPVLVQPVLGTGDTARAHELLSDLADRVDVPVFVVLAATPVEVQGVEYPAEQAAALLREELGDGLYIMKFDEGIAYARGFGKAAEIEFNRGYLAIRTAEKTGPEEYNRTTAVFDAAMLLRAAATPGKGISDEVLRDQMAQPWAFIATESHEHADQAAGRWVVAISAGLAVLIAGLILSRIAVRAPLGSRTTRESVRPSHAQGMPDTALQELDRVQGRFDVLTSTQLGSPQGLAADRALQAARASVGTGKDLDQVGAWVLALVADREMDRISKPHLHPYRPCVVDPFHGEADGTRQLAGSSIDAPVCRACTKKQGTFLTASSWRGDQTYLDTNTVWARTGFGALVDDLASQVLDQHGAR